MAETLSKTYDPKGMEEKIYSNWLEKKYFHAEVDKEKKPFSIVMPPPNITGKLHMGHALDNTMQDILTRFKRMQGYNALWQPGTDHASIATEVKIIEKLKEEGTSKEELGRENFLKRAWQWREEYGGIIISQLKKLGVSCDWDRTRFTMDEGCSEAVNEVFCRLYEKGLIYKGNKIVNWCPVCQTTISDAEVAYESQASHLWHIKYPVIGTDRFIEFATTRPETMLGDTAIAVNPEDDRYKDLVGKKALLPIINRELPIIADEYVDMEFGTGVVKITPGHDPNDFEVGKRHDLPIVNVMNDDASINENGGKYCGYSAMDARKAIVEELSEMGLLVKIEDYTHDVGTHDRCHTTVEPLVKKQWFVKMDDLIKPAAEAVQKGDIKLVPDRMKKIYFNWTDNIRDWCISRQLWWGHRIPAWYCKECGEMVVAKDKPEKCPKCGCTSFHQDEDSLDTWFSSALWPFSTLGWPEKTPELDYFYPTDVLVTGYDIIFFWVIRMIFSGYEQMGDKPFKTVLFHGLIRDSLGRKMSKSLGNGIDPLEVIDKYGADALRFTLITGNAPGNDMRFSYDRVEASRNFANKIWNASRFILMNLEGKTLTVPAEGDLEDADRWILNGINETVRDVTDNLEKFELGIAAQKIYDFIWDVFCDWYIEMVKPRLYSAGKDGEADEGLEKKRNAALWTLKTVLNEALKLLHPYMPFVTEQIYGTLREAAGDTDSPESIMISSWPVWREDRKYEKAAEEVELIKEAVRAIRTVRSDMNVAPSKKADMTVVSEEESVREAFEKGRLFFTSLVNGGEVKISADRTGVNDDDVSVVTGRATIFIPLKELVDLTEEIKRLEKEEQRLSGELKRSHSMLSNERFLSKAPEKKIQEEKEKLARYEKMMEEVKERLSQMKAKA
ncbi:MAG: valine--tRNA ligase [Lachnospiraceae bacterium]|nr:valine--tRNA ligase [Lachnospiraceae bacterium]